MAYVNPLDPATPLGSDSLAQGDDRIREVKAALIERIDSFFSGHDVQPWVAKSGAGGTDVWVVSSATTAIVRLAYTGAGARTLEHFAGATQAGWRDTTGPVSLITYTYSSGLLVVNTSGAMQFAAGVGSTITQVINGTTIVTVSSTGIITTGSLSFSASSTFVNGSLQRTAVAGMTLSAIAGSAYDLALYTAAGVNVLQIPTGTSNVVINGGGGTATLAGGAAVTGNLSVSGAITMQGGGGGVDMIIIGFGLPTARFNTLFGANASVGTLAGAGSENTVIGYSAGVGLTSGTTNTFLGSRAGSATITGSSNTGVGYNTLGTSDGSGKPGNNNTAVGQSAMWALNFGAGTAGANAAFNSALGAAAGADVTTGADNVFVGYNTGRGITTGSYNTIIGAQVTGLTAGMNFNILIAAGDGVARLHYDSANWGPAASADNTMSFGASGRRWTAVWAVNGTIQTSTIESKDIAVVQPSTQELWEAVNGVQIAAFTYKNDPGYNKKGHKYRHFGVMHHTLPQWMQTTDDGINPMSVATLGLAAVRDLQGQVQMLTARLMELENRHA